MLTSKLLQYTLIVRAQEHEGQPPSRKRERLWLPAPPRKTVADNLQVSSSLTPPRQSSLATARVENPCAH